MTRTSVRLLASLALVAVALVPAACGGSDDDASTGSRTKSQGTPAKGKPGGKLTELSASDVDYLDPGHTYYQPGYQVAFATQRPLYGYTPDQPTKAQPDLAADEPDISDDNKTITIKLRSGVKFAPPVNRVITSSDVKYAMERAFTENVGGQYTGYFGALRGAPTKPGKYRAIPGIETPDKRTLVLKLTKPVAGQVAAALVMPITAPVPKEYAERFDAENPSTYNSNVVASGPYMVRNDGDGKLVGYKAGRSIDLVRNPNWDAKTDFRPAYVDEILIRTNASDGAVAARQVLAGQNMIHDTNPPANILAQVVRRQRDQLSSTPSGGFRFFPLNTTIKPLDDINVRKAIIAGFNSDAARLARGGATVGKIGTHFLPPDFPGYEESGGEKGFGEDFMASPKGNPALAAAYMKKAGYPTGKYTGDQELLMVTSSTDPGAAQAEVAQGQLEKLGFKVKLRKIPQDAVYTEWCQVPAKKVAICGAAGWFFDYKDPQSMLEQPFRGSSINLEGNNSNLPQLDDPKIDAAMDKAKVLEGEARLKAWAQVNKMIVDQAVAIPFVWDATNIVHSKNVIAPQSPYHSLIDLAFTSIR